jgi:hypothetical protein
MASLKLWPLYHKRPLNKSEESQNQLGYGGEISNHAPVRNQSSNFRIVASNFTGCTISKFNLGNVFKCTIKQA